jgi:hypothetical protein
MPAANLPAEWDAILNEVQQCLAQTLSAAESRAEPTNIGVEAAAPVGREHDWQALCERLDNMQSRVTQAEDVVRQADLALEAAELALQAHLAAGASARQRLAEWAGRAIG